MGGAAEPFYRPATAEQSAYIFFREDFIASALHEVAHWCLAGPQRRQLPDYGYWYTEDDRDLVQQQAFFTVEARPQALESIFCEMLGVEFRPSIDNPGAEIPGHLLRDFEARVAACRSQFVRKGLPDRAQRVRRALTALALECTA
ncbi:diaminobutyrate-2-oxoglutarate transaminase [Luminiphilus syltensis NOR5-1B]|uniref:Diaminobutyrate-2-oxoglutarate transaminase n=1 Tax=Luminiphilus syltensis NOR5-1B TaxID=565045 RepID=B8KRQ9_9GAMM|nr:diaminobutyrate-2-oxoglutarate transaminase [Luminiphilus syltensis NOR5-1B]